MTLCAAAGAVAAVTSPGRVAEAVIEAVVYASPVALMLSIAYGLGAAAQYWLTRVLLTLRGGAPVHYVRWLDTMVAARLMYRSGTGGYVFIHHLVQDHLAAPPADAPLEGDGRG